MGQCDYYLWPAMKYRIYENNFSLQEMNDYLKRHYKSVSCQEVFSEGVRPA